MSGKFTAGGRCYVIAEIGANHNGDMALARRMIDIAKTCGADAVKFQSWDPSIFSKSVYEENRFLGDDYRDRKDFTLKEIVEEFAVGFEDMRGLSDHCNDVGIDFASTPFNERQLDELMSMGAPFVKIASMDLTNPRLLRAAARKKRTILLSTGFGSLDEIDVAVRTIEAENHKDIVLLHCVSLYPPEDAEVNLNNIDMLRDTYGYPVGFSDHTLGPELALAAIAKGAVVLEKHFTIDKEMFGWDHKVSVEPAELAQICRGRDRIHAALGSYQRTVGSREMSRRNEYRRSIVTARALGAGTVIRSEDIDLRRPGTGISSCDEDRVIGMRTVRTLGEDEVLQWTDLENIEPAGGKVKRVKRG